MKYSKLKSILSERKIVIADFCKQLQITRQGLQKSLDNDQLPYNKILLSCHILGITPDEFFEWENAVGINGVYASNISGINTQNSNEAIQALKDQLKEKDKQINKLLGIIEKGKKQ